MSVLDALQGLVTNNQNDKKLQAFLQQVTQANQDRQETRDAMATAAREWAKQNTPDASPPPGQASQPMIPPPPMNAQAMPHPAAMPGMAGGPQAMPPPGGMPRPGPPAPPPMPNQMAQPQVPPPPQGWKPSPSAPPALGGAPSGTPPQAGPPAGNSIAPPPTPAAQPLQGQAQGMPAAPGEPPPIMGVQMPMSGPKFVQAAMKGGATPLQAYQAYMQYKPMADQQEREYMDAFRIQADIAQKKIEYGRYLDKQAETEKKDQRDDARLAQGDARLAQQDRRIEDAEKKAAHAGAGTGAPAAGPMGDTREANASQVASGQPINQVISGYGKASAAARVQAHDDAIKLIMKDEGMSPKEAGMELARRTTDYVAGRSSQTQLTKMQGATRQAVQQLDFNVDKVSDEMKKLKSSDLSPVLNALVRGEEKWTGDPAYSSLFYYMNAAATESARLLSGGQASAAQLHQGAMEEAQKWANINMTPASWNAVAKSMKDEGNFRLKTYGDAIASGKVGAKADDKPADTAIPDGWSVTVHK